MNNLIEYSFNTFDSELTHYVWTIPEGYIAKIENDKIIIDKIK